MEKRLVTFIACLFLSLGMAFAQTRVTGTVVSSESGEPVIGASIKVLGTNTGTVTDAEGNFQLNVAKGAELEISYIGMEKKRVVVKGGSLNVQLESNDHALDDVVVVAYGTAKRQSLVGAQNSVTAKDIAKRPISNISSALASVAPGVQGLSSNGQPGSGSELMIRGFGSINASSSPLYIVDGAIYNGSLSDISPSDVQSVSILKDAASTALYGSSAGNGVVLITTKSGANAKQGKPHITLTINQGITQKGNSDYKTVNAYQYYPLRWQQWYNQYRDEYGLSSSDASYYANYEVYNDLGPQYMPYAGIKTFFNQGQDGAFFTTQDPSGNYPLIVNEDGTLSSEVTGLLWGDDLNWKDALFRNGYRQEYNLNGTYANDKLNSYFSLNYLNEDGYRKATSFERFSGRANIDYTANKWFKMGTNISFAKKQNFAPKRASDSYSSNSFLFYSQIAPIYPIHMHNADGSYVTDANGDYVYDYTANRPAFGKFNPVFEATADASYYDADVISNRSYLDFTIWDGLKFRTNLSYDLYHSTTKTRYNNVEGDQPQGLLYISEVRNTTITWNQLLTYTKTFGKHGVDVLLGHESYYYKPTSSSMSKEGMSLLGYDEMPAFTTMSSMDSGTDKYRKEGYFFRANYDYDQRINASLSYRHDGSSRFAKNNRWGDFWSFGAGWTLSNESWFKAPWVNYLKVRASYGETGNDNIGTYYASQTLYSFGYNNASYPGVRFSLLGTPDLTWETQIQADLGVEFTLFNRLRGTLEYFYKASDDLLFEYPLPASTGIVSRNMNLGKVKNTGFEFDLTYDILKGKDYSWSVNVNGTVLKNEIVRLPDVNRKDGIETGNFKYMEGHSIYDYYLYHFAGVDPDNGMAMYELDTETYPDGAINSTDKANLTYNATYAKKDYRGSAIPDLYGGFGTNASWKGIDFSVLFGYQLGGKNYDGMYQSLMSRSIQGGASAHVDLLKAWRQPGDVTDVPALSAGNNGLYSTETSDRWLTSASALMLKSLSLGYTLPRTWTNALSLGDVRVAVAGENLFLLSARKGLNPFNSYSGVQGASFYEYARTYTLSLTVNF